MSDTSYQVTVVIEKDEDGYYAYCPQLEGCQSQGDTLDEIKSNIQEAIDRKTTRTIFGKFMCFSRCLAF